MRNVFAARASQSQTRDLSGVVDIGNGGGSYFTSSYGAPDMAFQLLLTSAREALAVTAMGMPYDPDGTCTPDHARRAETYMGGLLLRDANFVPTRAVGQWDHRYTIEFEKQLIRSQNKLYVHSGSTLAFLRVQIEGKIAQNTFTVQNPADSRILTQFTDQELLIPQFFEQVLPARAYDAMLNRETGPGGNGAVGPESKLQVQMSFEIDGEVRSLIVTETPDAAGLLVIDPETQKVLCSMPHGYLAGLAQLVDGVRKGLNKTGGKHPKMGGLLASAVFPALLSYAWDWIFLLSS